MVVRKLDWEDLRPEVLTKKIFGVEWMFIITYAFSMTSIGIFILFGYTYDPMLAVLSLGFMLGITTVCLVVIWLHLRMIRFFKEYIR